MLGLGFGILDKAPPKKHKSKTEDRDISMTCLCLCPFWVPNWSLGAPHRSWAGMSAFSWGPRYLGVYSDRDETEPQNMIFTYVCIYTHLCTRRYIYIYIYIYVYTYIIHVICYMYVIWQFQKMGGGSTYFSFKEPGIRLPSWSEGLGCLLQQG